MENLSSLLPYLSEGFCTRCKDLLETRLRNLDSNGKHGGLLMSNGGTSADFCSANSSSFWSPEKSSASLANGGSQQKKTPLSTSSQTPVGRHRLENNSSPASVTSRQHAGGLPGPTVVPVHELGKISLGVENGRISADQVPQNSPSPSPEQNELMRVSQVGRKKDFVHMEKVEGRSINILQGLELHTRVFNAEEQKKIVDCVYNLQRMGQSGKLRARTYTEPRKWMRGKGRVTIQFGCCYNYAEDKHGNPPGIIRDEEVDPMPPLLKMMIKRLVRWRVLPPTCVPNSCIVNIYDEGDCIPPHIDHHDFVRPFCTVSFLTECNILFGSNLRVAAPGEFSGPVSIPLPVGSVLILKGNGADVAKHCVPAVPGKRISITFRKMDDSKLPFDFSPDPELQGLQPIGTSPSMKPLLQVQPSLHVQPHNHLPNNGSSTVGKANSSSSPFQLGKSDFPPLLGKDDFPPLGAQGSVNRSRSKN